MNKPNLLFEFCFLLFSIFLAADYGCSYLRESCCLRGSSWLPRVAIVPRCSASPLSPGWRAGVGGWQHVHCDGKRLSVCDFSSWEWRSRAFSQREWGQEGNF